MIFEQAPDNFTPKFEVVSVHVWHDNKLLFLKRPLHKPQGGTWGVPPAGKIDSGEDVLTAATRELFEETGIEAAKENLISEKKLFVRYPEYDFIYYVFSVRLAHQHMISLNHGEHEDFAWFSPKEALKQSLILDEDQVIRLIFPSYL